MRRYAQHTMDKYMFKRLTTYNVIATICAVMIKKEVPNAVLDVVRTTSLCMAASVYLIYVLYGIGAVIAHYRRLFPGLPTYLLIVIDLVIHLLPVIVLGLPTLLLPVVIGYGIVAAWYLLVREHIHAMYIDEMKVKVSDLIIFTYLPCVCALCVVRSAAHHT